MIEKLEKVLEPVANKLAQQRHLQAISSGMNDIIIKPFEPAKLFLIINNLIHKKNVS